MVMTEMHNRNSQLPGISHGEDATCDVHDRAQTSSRAEEARFQGSSRIPLGSIYLTVAPFSLLRHPLCGGRDIRDTRGFRVLDLCRVAEAEGPEEPQSI
jgi:hypothetical protein